MDLSALAGSSDQSVLVGDVVEASQTTGMRWESNVWLWTTLDNAFALILSPRGFEHESKRLVASFEELLELLFVYLWDRKLDSPFNDGELFCRRSEIDNWSQDGELNVLTPWFVDP